jgi:uncharacterized membrane protein
MKQSLLFLACTIILLTSSCTKNVVDKPVDNGGPYFSQVKQIIQNNCVSCHHQGGQGMPVILTSDDDIVNRAAAIKAAVADPVSPTNKRMPQDGQLSEADKNTIVAWFNKGGKASD